MERYLKKQIKSDLQEKMVFVAGPRQVGETTLTRSLLKNDTGYLSWDIPEGREAILKQEFPIAPYSYSMNCINTRNGKTTTKASMILQIVLLKYW